MIFFSNPILMPFELHKFMTDSKRSCTLWHSQSKWIIVSSLSLQRLHNLVSTFLILNKNEFVVKMWFLILNCNQLELLVYWKGSEWIFFHWLSEISKCFSHFLFPSGITVSAIRVLYIYIYIYIYCSFFACTDFFLYYEVSWV
jgi:hypothetical protein